MATERGSGSIGERIIEARLAFGSRRRKSMTQAELATLLEVTPGTVSQWESGTTEPTLRSVKKIAKALGVSPGWIAWGDRTDIILIDET